MFVSLFPVADITWVSLKTSRILCGIYGITNLAGRQGTMIQTSPKMLRFY